MKIKKLLGFLQILFFIWMFLSIPNRIISAVSNVGMGTIGYVETRNIANGVILENVMGNNFSGEQKGHTIEIAKGALTPFVTYGTYVNGGERLTSMVANAESQYGKTVVAAINGDFYDTSNGVPIGIMISNGKFVTSGTSGNSWPAIGFKADGSAIYGNPSFTMRFNDGVKNTTINHLNNDRKLNETHIYMYTSDYGATTKNTVPGKEVVLDIVSGEMKLGQTIVAKVESIGTTNVAIGQNKIVLSTSISNSSKFDTLTIGKEITIQIIDNKAGEGWSDVVQAIGYNQVLVENGVLTEVTNSDTAVHPRTAIGIKNDGSIVLFQVDGRQPGWSVGLSYKQIAEHLLSKGCKTVVNLDGGGSSTILARLPGDSKTTVLTKPSDGVERSNSNGIIFFANDVPDPNKELAYVHTFPNNLVILEGATTHIKTTATDFNYYPVDTPTNLIYETSLGIGSIDNKGYFTARLGSGTGTITVRSGTISTTLNVTVVDQITNVIADKTYLSISPGEEVEFKLAAYKDGMPIVCSNSSFTWELSSPVLGTLKNGAFKGTESSATGSIYVSYKAFRLTIPVEVGKQPQMINTFENTIMGVNWTSIIENPGNGGVGTVSVNTDERFVKFGEKSLRIDYDFTRATGTTSVTSMQMGGNFVLEGYPTHIGMWVYGDMQNTTVRTLLRDATGAASYISYTPEPVTWQGWKYIEAEVPRGLPTPISVQYPIRVMSIGARPKTAGTLYFDNLRVVYGFRNDDTLEPQTKNLLPEPNSTVSTNQPTISMTVWDEVDQNNIVTGINRNSIKFWLNNKLMSNVLIVDNPDGTITINYTPSALNPLRAGPQIVKIRVEDNYGNITIKNWQFYVAGDYAGVGGIIPSKDMIFAGDIFEYYITANTYQNFEKLEATLLFNHRALELKSITKVDQNITLGSVNLTNANSNGSINIVATGMNNLTQPSNKQLIRITFGVKEGFIGNSDSNIIFRDVKVTETGYSEPTIYLLPSYEVKVNYPYILSYTTSTVGRNITFKVTDHLMNPVKDAQFVVSGQNINVTTKTNDLGLAVLSDFTHLGVNVTFDIKAVKGHYFSETLTVRMVSSLGSDNPHQIIVSPGVNPSTSVNISWQTNLDTTDSIVSYRKVGDATWKEVTFGLTKPVHVVNGSIMQEYLAHIVTLEGLIPNTEYEYTVGSENKKSSVMKFKTVPDGNFSFTLLGDPQNTSVSGYNITKSAIDGALTKNPNISMLLFAGDMVDDVNMYSQWTAMESVLRNYFNSIITASATGNHDVIRNYSDPFKYAFYGPQNGVEVIGVNYYFEVGNAIFAFIDTETPDKYDEQAAWLNDIMANTDKTFKIVIMHRSVYAASYNESHIRNYWPRVFEQAEIDLVFSGHDHVYNSTTMYNEEKIATNYGVTYIAGGSAGGKFYNANNLSERYWIDFLYDDDYPVFTNASITGNILTLQTYSVVGSNINLINSIVINKDLKAETILLTQEIENIFAGQSFQFTGVLKNKNNQTVNQPYKWKLSTEEAGITITDSGLLVIDESFKETKTVSLVAYYGSFEYTYQVMVIGGRNLDDFVEGLLEVQNEFIRSIYR